MGDGVLPQTQQFMDEFSRRCHLSEACGNRLQVMTRARRRAGFRR